MMMRGVQKQNSVTTTSAFFGEFEKQTTRNEFIKSHPGRSHKKKVITRNFDNEACIYFSGTGLTIYWDGKSLYDNYEAAKILFESANEILGFRISDIMFSGS